MADNIKLMDLPEKEMILPGTRLCSGCGPQLAYRMILKALGPKTIVTIPASCMTVIHGMQGFTPVLVPVLNTPFMTVAASASGIVASLKNQNLDKEVTVLAIAGDGGTVDIGIQALSGAAERQTDMIYCCYDNEAYMNTGVQRSGSTPHGAYTTTTPNGKSEYKKDMPRIMEAHGLSYVATACSSYPMDIYQKFIQAKKMKGQGVRYIHIFTPCPPGWRFSTEKTIEIGRLAVKAGIWPMYEIINGKMILSKPSKPIVDPQKRIPVEEYLSTQGRFKNISDNQLKETKSYIENIWERINKRIY